MRRSQPVPQKVLDDMRTCQAAVIHVSVERYLLDEQGNKVPQLNGNVLIEIGAAMALYKGNFVLLVGRRCDAPVKPARAVRVPLLGRRTRRGGNHEAPEDVQRFPINAFLAKLDQTCDPL